MDRKGKGFTLLFLSPWLVGFLGFMLIPLLMALYWSFTNFDVLQAPQWVGLQNYVAILHDATFWTAVRNTLYITVIGVPAGIIVGLGTAMLLEKPITGMGFYRAAIYLPAIVPPVAIAIIWLWILNPDYGLLNAILSVVHIKPLGWLADPYLAKISMLMMVVWGGTGQIMIIMLAGLKDVPMELYEAAMIDGAGWWRKFSRITLPMLGPVIFYNVVVGVIFYLQFFTQAFVVTANNLGAPVNSTLFYALYLYQNAFQFLKMGYAAAMAWILFIVIVTITLALFWINRKVVFYGGGQS